MKSIENKKPFDRKEVFILAFRQNYGLILKTSLAMLVFALPALIVFFWSFIELYLLGDITVDNAIEMYSIQSRMYIWLIPAFAILSVGAAGAFYVIRRLVWDEDVIFFKDFVRGIKNNALQSIVSGVLFIAFVGALGYVMNTLVLNVDLGSTYWMLYIIQLFLTVVDMLLLLFQYAIIAVYNDSMFRIIKNSFALVWMSFPRSIVMLLAAFAPIFILLAFSGVYVIYLIVVLFLSLVGFGYGILLFTLHAHSVFDKYINKSSFPDIYKKGLYHEGTGIDLDSTDYRVEGSNLDAE